MADPGVRANQALTPALVEAFERAKDDDPRVRRYLALAIGRLGPPLAPEAVAALTKALQEPEVLYTPDFFSRMAGATGSEAGEARISAIWALGSSGDPSVVATVEPFYKSPDAGVRKMAVYALGALPGDTQINTLVEALRDPEADVRWNAAVALARHGNREGTPIIGQMLDRPHLQQAVKRESRLDQEVDPVAEVMISGLRAAAILKDPSLKPQVEALSQNDSSLKVRQAALEALKEM
jgi:HEAT repeat protein